MNIFRLASRRKTKVEIFYAYLDWMPKGKKEVVIGKERVYDGPKRNKDWNNL